MKDIKSILIGVFSTTCLFLFMGQTIAPEIIYNTEQKSKIGKYQQYGLVIPMVWGQF